jgi:hypothetical protein
MYLSFICVLSYDVGLKTKIVFKKEVKIDKAKRKLKNRYE